jgi:hypothetical protein
MPSSQAPHLAIPRVLAPHQCARGMSHFYGYRSRERKETMKRLPFLVLPLMLLFSGSVFAQTQTEMKQLKQENEELKQRIEALEQSLSEVRQLLEEPEAVAEVKEEKPTVVSTHPIELYGFIKFDAAYDTQRVSIGDYIRWVESEQEEEDDNQFNMTARETRLGMRILGPTVGDMVASGRLEIDFYSGDFENKANVMMRHAYLQLDWPQRNFTLLAGQTSDVISPLYPATLNYPVLWWAGNIGYRRPQFRLTKGFKLKEDYLLLFQGAVSQTIGRVFDSVDTGGDSGFPTLQGRTALTFPCFAGPATIGVSGHWGQEEFDSDDADDKDVDSWSANLDLALPLARWLVFKTEIFTGSDLEAFLGGIGQGVNVTTLEAIDDSGGWAAFSLGPFNKWQFNMGAGMDNPENSDLNKGDRSRNSAVWGNSIYSVTKDIKVGLELSYWKTKYVDIEDGETVRFQTSLIYFF